MEKEIYKAYNTKLHMQLVVNDLMSSNPKQNKILFEIHYLNNENKVVKSVNFFMDILDAKTMFFYYERNMISIDHPFSAVRGKSGTARSFNFSLNEHHSKKGLIYYYTIKIDKGSGHAREDGYTNFENKEDGLYFNMSIEDTTKMLLSIRDRINQRENLFLLNIQGQSITNKNKLLIQFESLLLTSDILNERIGEYHIGDISHDENGNVKVCTIECDSIFDLWDLQDKLSATIHLIHDEQGKELITI